LTSIFQLPWRTRTLVLRYCRVPALATLTSSSWSVVNWRIRGYSLAAATSLARSAAVETFLGVRPVESAKWVLLMPSARALAFMAAKKALLQAGKWRARAEAV